MAYVVRDRRAGAVRLAGLVVSAVVVVGICAATHKLWIAAVGLPLAAVWTLRDARAEGTRLRADDTGIAVRGRWVPWQDVEEVHVADGVVRVTLGAQAPLPPWERSRVTGSGGRDERLRLQGPVGADGAAVADGIRSQAPDRVVVSAD